LRTGLSTLQRLFAPFLPFVTEEVWSWWQPGSIHRAAWPAAGEMATAGGEPLVLDVAATVLGAIRRAKSEAKLSQRAPVERVVVRDTAERVDALERARADLVEAGSVAELVSEVGEPTVNVTLATP
jgi:valyl-tRNA synthetase